MIAVVLYIFGLFAVWCCMKTASDDDEREGRD